MATRIERENRMPTNADSIRAEAKLLREHRPYEVTVQVTQAYKIYADGRTPEEAESAALQMLLDGDVEPLPISDEQCYVEDVTPADEVSSDEFILER